RAHNFISRVRYGQRRLKRLSHSESLAGVFLSFLQLGLTGFGGGLAALTQIRALTVQQRKWFTEREYAETIALAQSLPGSVAGNAATYIGYRLRGIKGAVVSTVGFILPSMIMMIGLAILYRHFRTLPRLNQVFNGFNAALVGVIVVAAWRIGRQTLTKPWQWYVAGLAVIAVSVFGMTPVEMTLASGLIGIVMDAYAEERVQRLRKAAKLAQRRRRRMREIEQKNFVGGYLTRAMADERVRKAERAAQALPEEKPRLPMVLILAAMPIVTKLGLLLAIGSIFLRIGAASFGGGFVTLPLIETEVVQHYHWMAHQEFADATALAQITPGPVLIVATFIGYRVAGTLGALTATICVFLPAFVFTLVAGSSLRRFRANRQVQSFLRGVTPAVVGMLISAALSIGRAGYYHWSGLLVTVVAGLVIWRFRPNVVWVMFGGGALGVLAGLIFDY
ncbi:MAG: chromate efflux transporter, partial [Pyrinomonadaceae bacterium]